MNVLVADEYELIVDGLRVVLREIDPEIRVLPAKDAASALAAAREAEHIQLAILSLRMPGMDGLHGLDDFVAAFPGLPVVVTADDLTRHEALDCMRRGAAGCVPKSFSKGAIAGVLKIVLDGHPFLPASYVLSDGTGTDAEAAAASDLDRLGGTFTDLTPKERLVLQELVTGSPNKDIASRLGLEEVTVKFHLRRIFRKLGTKNRGETIRLAILGNR